MGKHVCVNMWGPKLGSLVPSATILLMKNKLVNLHNFYFGRTLSRPTASTSVLARAPSAGLPILPKLYSMLKQETSKPLCQNKNCGGTDQCISYQKYNIHRPATHIYV